MVRTVLKRFPVQRVILMVDRGALSLENIAEFTGIADQCLGNSGSGALSLSVALINCLSRTLR